MAEIEIGATYEYEPGHDAPTGRALKGRKALVLEHRREEFYGVRWPNGSADILLESELRGPVEPATPGVDEDLPALRRHPLGFDL